MKKLAEGASPGDLRGRKERGREGLLTVPGLKLKLTSSRIWATRMAKDRLAWMWQRWLRMVLTELRVGRQG